MFLISSSSGELTVFLSVVFFFFLQLTLTPAQQQLLLQQAQAQLLAAAVQHSASQQHSAAGATISASAATPMTQIPLSQPIQIAQVGAWLLNGHVLGQGVGGSLCNYMFLPLGPAAVTATSAAKS